MLRMLRERKLPVEMLDASTLAPLTKGTYGQPQPVIILGHYAQILNFLVRAHQRSVAVPGQDLPKTVYEQFKYLLEGVFY